MITPRTPTKRERRKRILDGVSTGLDRCKERGLGYGDPRLHTGELPEEVIDAIDRTIRQAAREVVPDATEDEITRGLARYRDKEQQAYFERVLARALAEGPHPDA